MDECPEMHVGDMGERQPADFDIAEGDLWQDGSLSQAACEDDDTFDLEEHSEDSFRHEETLVADDPFHEGQVFWRVPEGDPDAVLVEADDPSLAEVPESRDAESTALEFPPEAADDAWDVLEEDLGDFVDEEAIKQDLLAEIQTMRDSQDKELLEEEEEEDATEWEMWQVDEEEFGAVEETAAEAEDQRAQTAAASRPAQSQNAAGVRMMLPSSKKKPMPPSEPPSWYRADAGKADRRDGKELKGTWTSPPQTRVKGGKGKQAKGKANERKRRVEYDGGHAPPLRRKSWPDKSRVVFQAGENWNGHDRSDSDWHGSSRGGRSREGTRHGKSKCDWSQDWTDWKAWRDDGDGEGTALEQKKQEQQKSGRGSPSSSTRVTRGWSWKRR